MQTCNVSNEENSTDARTGYESSLREVGEVISESTYLLENEFVGSLDGKMKEFCFLNTEFPQIISRGKFPDQNLHHGFLSDQDSANQNIQMHPCLEINGAYIPLNFYDLVSLFEGVTDLKDPTFWTNVNNGQVNMFQNEDNLNSAEQCGEDFERFKHFGTSVVTIGNASYNVNYMPCIVTSSLILPLSPSDLVDLVGDQLCDSFVIAESLSLSTSSMVDLTNKQSDTSSESNLEIQSLEIQPSESSSEIQSSESESNLEIQFSESESSLEIQFSESESNLKIQFSESKSNLNMNSSESSLEIHIQSSESLETINSLTNCCDTSVPWNWWTLSHEYQYHNLHPDNIRDATRSVEENVEQYKECIVTAQVLTPDIQKPLEPNLTLKICSPLIQNHNVVSHDRMSSVLLEQIQQNHNLVNSSQESSVLSEQIQLNHNLVSHHQGSSVLSELNKHLLVSNTSMGLVEYQSHFKKKHFEMPLRQLISQSQHPYFRQFGSPFLKTSKMYSKMQVVDYNEYVSRKTKCFLFGDNPREVESLDLVLKQTVSANSLFTNSSLNNNSLHRLT